MTFQISTQTLVRQFYQSQEEATVRLYFYRAASPDDLSVVQCVKCAGDDWNQPENDQILFTMEGQIGTQNDTIEVKPETDYSLSLPATKEMLLAATDFFQTDIKNIFVLNNSQITQLNSKQKIIPYGSHAYKTAAILEDLQKMLQPA